MQRALGRAYQRLQGAHPRRPVAPFSRTAEIACDVLLGVAFMATLCGLALLVWGLIGGVQMLLIVVGAALLVVGAALLLTWERVAWEPFEDRLSTLT